MSGLGSFGSFDPKKEPWAHYASRFHCWLKASKVTDAEMKKAVFLATAGPDVYSRLVSLMAPNLPEACTLKELITALKGHFEPAPSIILERFRFFSRVRRLDESVRDFVSGLQKMALTCAFENFADQMVRDRVVCGINDEAIQRRLLACKELSLAEATEKAYAMEAAAKNMREIRGMPPPLPNQPIAQPTAQAVTPSGQGPKGLTRDPRDQRGRRKGGQDFCFRCGSDKHKASTCRFATATCYTCGKPGHLAKVCQSGRRHRPRQARQLQPELQASSEDESGGELFHLRRVNAVASDAPFRKPPPAIIAPVSIHGVPIQFEVDSGAPYTLVTEAAFKKFSHLVPSLSSTKLRLRSFSSHPITILGWVQVPVVFQGNDPVPLPLLVVRHGTANLAGRNWFQPLGLDDAFGKKLLAANQVSEPGTPLHDILGKHKCLFAPGLGCFKSAPVHLDLKPGVSPKFCKARPVPYALRIKVNEELDRLLAQGIIEPVKTAVWAAPVVPVLKASGAVRLCGDFKVTANTATVLEQYPLPKIEDLFAQIGGGKLFSKLDLRDAYCQLVLDEASRNLLVINTLKGLFRYTRLPFGVASAPAIFQREMDVLLQGQAGASAYLDDLLVTGATTQEHLKNLDQVLTRLEAAGCKLNIEKCKFLQSSVEYLGHRVDGEGLHPIESKVAAIRNAPTPKNVEELRSFIGLITYYSKFLPNMSQVLAPLHGLLKKGERWVWGEAQLRAFDLAKRALLKSSFLVHFDNTLPVVLACDASPYGVGAVLSHRTAGGEQPIAFASRTLSKAEQNYSQIERESLALIFGVTRFRNFLLGRHFTLVTDHRPLVSLLSERKNIPAVAAARIQRWALILAAYSYSIEYCRGSQLGHADACSRLPIQGPVKDPPIPPEVVLAFREVFETPLMAEDIAQELARDPFLAQVTAAVQRGWPSKISPDMSPFWKCRDELSLEQGVLLRGTRVFVPARWRSGVLETLHGAHQGIKAVKALARSSVWWPGIDGDIEGMVSLCQVCREHASMPPARHVAWPETDLPWDRVHIDHAGPVDGHMLLVVVDAATKWMEVVPVPSTSTSATIAALWDILARWGMPRSVVTDNGTSYTSEEFAHFLKWRGITHFRTAPFHPNSNGLAERMVRTIKAALAKCTQGTMKERLAKVLFYLRRVPAAATGVSPAQAMLGRPLRSQLDLLKPNALRKPASKGVAPAAVFQPGDEVWARFFGQGPRWVPGVVTGTRGGTMVQLDSSFGPLCRHADQLRHGASSGSKTPIRARGQEKKGSPSLPLATEGEGELVQQHPPGSPKTSGHPQKKPERKASLRRSTRDHRPPDKLNL